jgi:pimeloyl-ACP methyl ester carboxylesterase/DNA-binding CsgD family transcriptional regulator
MPHPPEQIRFCKNRDGVRIAYATCGEGPPLVWAQHWAHHLNFDWDGPVWHPWLSMLTRRHTLIRYDCRGCGLSDRERVVFSFEKYLNDLEVVVEAAGIERFVLFGMSGVGSGIAMAYAVRHPGGVARLILHGGQTRGRFARNATPDQVEEANTRLKVYARGWPSETPAYSQFFTSLHMPDATAEQTRQHQHLLHLTTSPANAIGMLRSFWELDVCAIAPQIRCPTLVLHARGDAVIPFDEGRAVAALIPGARFVSLESRNHIILDSEPAWQQLVGALDDFLPAEPARSAGIGGTPLDELTTREHEVLELVAQGLDNDAIGKQLYISKRTARNHVSAILAKLGATSRAQAIVRARDAGFGKKTAG